MAANPERLLRKNCEAMELHIGNGMPSAVHDSSQYTNNRAEQSHKATRVRDRGMRKFKSVKQAQRFPGPHAAVSNLLDLGRHQVSAKQYWDLRISAFGEWAEAVA